MEYHRFRPSDCKDIEIRKFEFVKKAQFLYFPSTNIFTLVPSSSWDGGVRLGRLSMPCWSSITSGVISKINPTVGTVTASWTSLEKKLSNNK